MRCHMLTADRVRDTEGWGEGVQTLMGAIVVLPPRDRDGRRRCAQDSRDFFTRDDDGS